MERTNPPSEAELAQLRQAIAPVRDRLKAHGIYARLAGLDDLRIFMEHHVLAVWDFMSLLKWLQRHLTCTEVPWIPQGDPVSRRLINEIVLEEESDDDGHGGFSSHFEMYLAAMQQCGADTRRVQKLVQSLRQRTPVDQALAGCGAPAAAVRFARETCRLVAEGSPHRIAAAFALGREDVIPEMFRQLVADLDRQFPGQLATFRHYLERHISLDEEHHTPLALRMLAQLCGNDPVRWAEAAQTAGDCLLARIELWDGVVAALPAHSLAARSA